MGRLDIAGGTMTISTTACIWDTPGTLVQLSGGTLNVNALDTKGNPAHFQWTGGTLNLGNPGGLAVGAFGTLGEFVTLSPSSNLMTPVLEINSDGEVALAGGSVTVDTFTNNGVLTMASGKLDTAVLGIGNDGTLTGGTGTGSATVSGGSVVAGAVYLGSTAGGTGNMVVSGSGDLTAGRLAANDFVVDGGTVTVLASSIGFNPVLDGSLVAGYLHDGAIIVHAGSVDVPRLNIGVTSGQTGSYVQTGGTVTAATVRLGHDTAPGADPAIGNAHISGGTLTTDLLAVGTAEGGVGRFDWSVGTIGVQALTMAGDATLGITLAGTTSGVDYAPLEVDGSATLTGTLDISRAEGYAPQAGDTFVILTFDAHTGTFANVTGLTAGPGLLFHVKYNVNDVTLVVGPPAPGDCDADGDVDLTDYSAFANCLNGPLGGIGASCGCADFDEDGDVDLYDAAAFQASRSN